MATIAPPRAAEVDLWLEPPEEDSGGNTHVGRSLKIVGALFGILFLASIVIPIGGAVIGSGQVGVESRVKRIAHPTGGVIAEIAVRNGQHVAEGDLLIRLRDTVSGAQAEFLGMTVEQLLARRSRLEAERLGSATVRFPEELTAAKSATATAAMADERQTFALRKSEQSQVRAQLGARIERNEEEIKGYEAEIASLRAQRELIQPELEGLRDLWTRRLVTINRLNELERTAVSLDGSIASRQSSIAATQARMTETRQQLIQLDQSRRAEASTELAQVNTALNDQRIRSVSAAEMQQDSAIRAPYAGTVEKIAFAAIGDVIQPAEAIMEIVPDNELTVIEASISPTDIDRVATGQPARLRFTAFNLSATPEFTGKVIYVATDRSQDPNTGIPYFLVRIELDQTAIRAEGLELRAGMPAEVYIETGKRPLISFLTKPLRDQFARAFRSD